MKKQTAGAKAPIDLSRRSFLRTGAAGAAAMTLAKQSASAAEPSDAINIALIGYGSQGQTLMRAIQKVASVPVKWVAVCDLLESQAKSAARAVSAHKPGSTSEYAAYTRVEDMLQAHPEIHAVFIAVPDWLHEPFTSICHQAGKDVYCEKMMSNSLEAAAKMVKSQRSSGKLLQIGHQRRSNPRYRYVRDTILHSVKVCGRITHAYGQWNRGVTVPINARYNAEQEKLIKDVGYDNVFEFLNWRWYKKYGGGPMSDLGAHQIDIFNWMFGVTPRSVTASGGTDYFKNIVLTPGTAPVTYEHPDNAIAVYEYDVPGNGLVRVVYQVITTNSSMQAYEKYMGDKGTVVLAEVDTYNQVYREKWDSDQAKWEGEFFGKGYLKKSADAVRHKFWERPRTWYRPDPWLDKEGVVDVRASTPLDPYELPIVLNLPYHTPHVENFLQTVHKKGKQTDLNCPVEDAYQCAVAVIKVNDLVQKGGGRIEFQPGDFTVA
ncbi:MAG: Gfo/Idh/MocA family oxidoreductase [Verrucomicrobiales bacterium]|nr:Gfo/Idh/MocA family oxidoreductase [Verrucomicrobiales bacterium]